MKKAYYLLLLFILPLPACQFNGDEGVRHDFFIIRGQLENAESIVLKIQELTTTDLLPVDSIMTAPDGSFSYRAKLEEAAYLVFRTDRDNHITLVVEPGEEIIVHGDAMNLPDSHRISGSEASVLLSSFRCKMDRNYERVDSLAEVFRRSKYQDDFISVRQELESAYRSIFREQQALARQFIRDNPQSLASIIVLYHYFGNHLLLKESEDFEYFELLGSSLSTAYPTNRHVLDLTRRVSRHRRNEDQRRIARENLAIGQEAPEIILPDPEGNMQALSSLRGNYVLIDFWATWCAPCRKVNARLGELHAKYHEMGFEIYGVSLDRTREQWLQGIKDDQVIWLQVSDLRHWSSPVISLYQVKGIPYSLLIDPEGRIVQKGITMDELSDYLASAFGSYSDSKP